MGSPLSAKGLHVAALWPPLHPEGQGNGSVLPHGLEQNWGTGKGQVLGTLITYSRNSEQEPPKGRIQSRVHEWHPVCPAAAGDTQTQTYTENVLWTDSLLKTPNVHLKMPCRTQGLVLPCLGRGSAHCGEGRIRDRAPRGPGWKGCDRTHKPGPLWTQHQGSHMCLSRST